MLPRCLRWSQPAKSEGRRTLSPPSHSDEPTHRALACKAQPPKTPCSRHGARPLRISALGLLSASGFRPPGFSVQSLAPCPAVPRPCLPVGFSPAAPRIRLLVRHEPLHPPAALARG